MHATDSTRGTMALVLFAALLPGQALLATRFASPARADDGPTLLVEEDFEKGADRWEPTDAKAWKVVELDGNHVFSQHAKSKYKPPHRSPYNIALLKETTVGDFVLTARAQSTCREYNHRDMCLFFGYQDPGHFYYVHLGKKTDDHANQIFIVNGAARTKISTRTTPGTPWDDAWHDVKIVRDADKGTIEIYFDDMDKPVMTASDTTFTWGRVGLGSFDDSGNWDDVRLSGTRVAPPAAGAQR